MTSQTTSHLTRDDARAIARVLYAVHQRRAERERAQGSDDRRPVESTTTQVGGPR